VTFLDEESRSRGFDARLGSCSRELYEVDVISVHRLEGTARDDIAKTTTVRVGMR
jgi:hypothetical protein